MNTPGASEAELVKILEATARELEERDEALFLIDVTGATVGSAFMATVKRVAKESWNIHCARQAVMGIDPMKRVLFGSFAKATASPMRPVGSLEEAVIWLDAA